jgi:hypothetical protein
VILHFISEKVFEKKFANGSKETHLQNGTIWRTFADGTEIIDFVNGEREIRTFEYRVSDLNLI